MTKLFLVLSNLLLAPAMGMAQGPGRGPQYGWQQMPMMCGHHYGCGWPCGIVCLIIAIAVVIGIVYVVVKVQKSRTGGAAREETPLDILKRRYASGEVSKEELDKMKQDLQE